MDAHTHIHMIGREIDRWNVREKGSRREERLVVVVRSDTALVCIELSPGDIRAFSSNSPARAL